MYKQSEWRRDKVYAKKCSPKGNVFKAPHRGGTEQCLGSDNNALGLRMGQRLVCMRQGRKFLETFTVRVDRVYQATQLSSTLGRNLNAWSLQLLTPWSAGVLKWVRG